MLIAVAIRIPLSIGLGMILYTSLESALVVILSPQNSTQVPKDPSMLTVRQALIMDISNTPTPKIYTSLSLLLSPSSLQPQTRIIIISARRRPRGSILQPTSTPIYRHTLRQIPIKCSSDTLVLTIIMVIACAGLRTI